MSKDDREFVGRQPCPKCQYNPVIDGTSKYGYNYQHVEYQHPVPVDGTIGRDMIRVTCCMCGYAWRVEAPDADD